MPAAHPRLHRDRALVLQVDVQGRLTPSIPPDTLDRLVKLGRTLLHSAKVLGLPILAAEQYPKGLGPTVPELAELLPAPPLAKVHFSCAADPAILRALETTGRKQVIVFGMETHVCVFQSVRDLVAMGFQVHVCADAVASRTEEHRLRGLDLCREAGATVTTAETAVFDLLQQSGTPEFKAIAPWLK